MLRWILAPIVGALIGYITNDIAIRMLFHPYKSYHIGGFHVPFTPGLIPAQQERIARAIGTMVSNQLLNEETLRAALLSETVLERVRSAVEEGITGLGNDTETVREFLCTRWPEEKVQLYRHRASSSAERRVVERLSDMDIGHVIATSIENDINQKLSSWGPFSATFEGLTASIGRSVENLINTQIAEKGPDIIHTQVEKLADDILDARLCDVYQAYEDRVPKLVSRVVRFYRAVVDENLDRMLSMLDIEQIVVDKINSLDPAQLETMVFGVMKRELRAIVYLGAALGFLMGFINLLLLSF